MQKSSGFGIGTTERQVADFCGFLGSVADGFSA